MEEDKHQQVRARKVFSFYFQWFHPSFSPKSSNNCSAQINSRAEFNSGNLLYLFPPFFSSIWSHWHLYSLVYRSLNLYKYFALLARDNQMNWWHEFFIAFYIQFFKTWLPWNHFPKRQWYIFLCKPRLRLQFKKTRRESYDSMKSLTRCEKSSLLNIHNQKLVWW